MSKRKNFKDPPTTRWRNNITLHGNLDRQSRKKLYRFLPFWVIIVLILVFVGLAIYQRPSSSEETAPSTIARDTIVINFAGVPITAGQIDDAEIARVRTLIQEGKYNNDATQRNYIADYALFSLFNKIEVVKQSKNYNLTPDDLINHIIPASKVDDKTAYQFYQAHPELFARSAPQIHIREIVVEDKTLATHLLDQLHSGASFSLLAQNYSLDPPQYRDQGGDLGWIAQGQMPSEWDDVAFSLSPGQISTVFQVGKQYFILQMIDKPLYDVIPYKELSPPAAVIASQYYQQEQFHKWLSMKILGEHIVVINQSYSQIVQNAMQELQAHPDQNVSSL
jgi:parvulin-like peptidyl-prolyl isomerase